MIFTYYAILGELWVDKFQRIMKMMFEMDTYCMILGIISLLEWGGCHI